MLLPGAALISQHLPIAERDALLRCASDDFGVTLMSFGPRLAAGMAFVAQSPLPLRPTHSLTPTTTNLISIAYPIARPSRRQYLHLQHYTSDCIHFRHLDPETIAPRFAWSGTAKGGRDQD